MFTILIKSFIKTFIETYIQLSLVNQIKTHKKIYLVFKKYETSILCFKIYNKKI